MATIRQITPTTWQGEFNRQAFRITKARDALTLEHLTGDGKATKITADGEIKSLVRFYNWHLASKQDVSELPALFAVADGKREE